MIGRGSPGLGQGPGPFQKQLEVALPRVADGPVHLERHPGRLGGGDDPRGWAHRLIRWAAKNSSFCFTAASPFQAPALTSLNTTLLY